VERRPLAELGERNAVAVVRDLLEEAKSALERLNIAAALSTGG